jgi:aerobic-type carbon monoxide dehydrogenase small subunit (CoxS/CutS family)
MPDQPATPPPADGLEGVLAARVSRRGFMQSLGVSAAAASVANTAEALAKGHAAGGADGDAPSVMGPNPVDLSLTVNGKKHALKVEPGTTLLEALRVHAGLTGTKEICDRGSCGGCSVLVDGVLTISCMMLAVDAAGASITTVEGLAKPDGTLHPLQEAFIRHDALQCGYCTPGFLVAGAWLMASTPKPTLPQIQQAMAGNICRCGTYTNIFNAVLEASGQRPIIDGTIA